MPKRRNRIAVWTLLALVAVLGARQVAGAFQATQGQTVQAPRFEVDPMWPKPLPNHWILGSAVGVAVDSRDHVFVVNLTDSFTERTEIGLATNPPTGECCRPAPNVLEFDADGNLVGHWGGPGQGYTWPTQNHGIAVDNEGNVWIAGSGGNDTRILKFSRDGKFLMEVGKAVAPASTPTTAAQPDTTYQGVAPARGAGRGGRGGGRGGRGGRGGPPPLPPNSASTEAFGGPAEISFDLVANEGFVSDGYRNRRVAVIDLRTGAIKRFWGANGNRPQDVASPQQFSTVHCAELANDGQVYVCDRGNNRIQVFRKDGSFVKEKVLAPETRGSGSVWDIAFSRDPQQRFLYVADGMNKKVHILDRQSLEVLSSFGAGGRQPGQFHAVHSIATDSRGNIYTAETLEGKRLQKFLFRGVQAVPRNQGVVWPRR